MATSDVTAAVRDDLAESFGDRFTVNDTVRAQHGVDEGWHAGVPPETVVFPTSTDEVAAVVRACAPSRDTSPRCTAVSASTCPAWTGSSR